MRFGFVVPCIILGVCLGLLGCSPTLKDARVYQQQGQHRKALEAYRSIGRTGGSLKAFTAQHSVVQLTTQLERWKELPSEATKLASYLDPEDDFSKTYQKQPTIWKRSQEQAAQAFLTCGRKSLQRARRLGDPVAYVAAGRLFGLYLERFPKGPARIEAAASRGIALAVRGDCKSAMSLFDRATHWNRKATSTSSNVRTMLFRGALGCRIRLWQERRAVLLEQVADGKRKPKQGKAMSQRFFRKVVVEAQTLLKIAPKRGAIDLLQHTSLLQKGGAFSGTLQLLLLVIDTSKHRPLVQIAKRKALQVFGGTRNWKPLILPLQRRLARVPKSRRDLFWNRVQTLVVLHGVREAQVLVQKKQPKKAAQMVMTAFQEAPKTREMQQTFYKAALVLEEQKQWKPASKLFLALFERAPQGRLAPMALYRHADISKKKGRLPEAARSFELLANSYPKLKVAPRVFIAARALYEAYHVYRRMGAFSRARKVLAWMFKRYPSSLSVARMRVFLRRNGRLPRMRRNRRWRRRRRRGRRRIRGRRRRRNR